MMFTIACVPEEPFGSENQISDPEVLKAKAWFESQEANLSRGNSENLRNNSSSIEKRANWNLTKKHKNAAGQEVLEVSLQVNKTMVSRYMLEKFKNKRVRPHQISQNLLMVEKANGEYDIFIFKIHSETDLSVNNRRDFFYEVNYGKTPSDFSGELVITTINEELIRGWRVNDGKTLMRFRVATGKKIPNSANHSGTCGYTETESCQVTTSMEYDSFLEEETMSSELNCTYTYQYECIDQENNSQGPASEEPDPLEGTGGGGGGLEGNEKDDCDTSQEDLKKAFPNAPDTFLKDLETYLNKYGKSFGIDSKEKMQHFLSQAGHESTNYNGAPFSALEENLNYRWRNLGTAGNWKKYFNPITNPTVDPLKANPNDFRRSTTSDFVNPEKFANYVYNRKELGNTNYGDGYKYRGRGIFQLTGKANYAEFDQFYRQNFNPQINILNNPDLLSTNTEIATLSALWFFQKKVINSININNNTTVEVITKKINGGKNGLDHRKSLFSKALQHIKCL